MRHVVTIVSIIQSPRESPRFSCQIIVVFSTAFFIYFEIKDAK